MYIDTISTHAPPYTVKRLLIQYIYTLTHTYLYSLALSTLTLGSTWPLGDNSNIAVTELYRLVGILYIVISINIILVFLSTQPDRLREARDRANSASDVGNNTLKPGQEKQHNTLVT